MKKTVLRSWASPRSSLLLNSQNAAQRVLGWLFVSLNLSLGSLGHCGFCQEIRERKGKNVQLKTSPRTCVALGLAFVHPKLEHDTSPPSFRVARCGPRVGSGFLFISWC